MCKPRTTAFDASRKWRHSACYVPRVKKQKNSVRRKCSKTREEIKQLHAQAQEQIERSKEQALQHMRAEVADIAVQAAERVLRANLDAQRQRTLVDTFLQELGTN